MLISKAYAADVAAPVSAPAEGVPSAIASTPGTGEALMWNMGMVLVLVVLFYFLLILPQQRRFKEHSTMLAGLKKGDRVVTGGGLIGVIDTITDGSDEVVVDLGNGTKVTALRSTLQGKNDPLLNKKAANDAKLKKENKQ
jgi:preprotein translocase subunit YajC